MANLVIVESPSKASTIKSYLGSNYKVIASKGHVRDLPKSTLGVDIENNFDAHYINIRGKGDLIKEIRKEAKAANKVFLATDPDREGEAISWHLAIALGIPVDKTLRVTFNEITKTAVKTAIKNPRQVDMSLVDAQQARRLVDRILGYKLSPLLWKSVKSGLSAGRVQSVATRIVVEREEEIKAFIPDEYWTIDATLLSSDNKPFTVRFYGDENGKITLSNQDDAMKVVNAVEGKQFKVASIKRSTRRKMPAPPFTTSTLQQDASRHLGFQSQRIMRVAQELYEGINLGPDNGGVQGLITYMRTDSLRVSAEAQTAAREFIGERYGEEYNTESPRIYKSKSGAQDAHEAIRPVKISLEPSKIKSYLTSDQYKIYKLIWERFIASQMESANLATLTADFESEGYIFRTGGYTVTFPGYMVVYVESEEETHNHDEHENQKDIKLPDLHESEMLNSDKIDPAKHFTEPPPRYNEASLIKFLEEKGIGRPSTYTPIITTIVTRNYVKRDGKALVPTPLGEITTKIMRENFADIVDYKFTADMEDQLDDIENGSCSMNKVLADFWQTFEVTLKQAEERLGDVNIEIPAEETDIICDKCGSKMIVKNGRFGKFAACPNYPKCRNTKPLVKVEEEEEQQIKPEEEKTEKAQKKTVVADFKCENCGADMVLRSGRYGSFYACVNYPKCKTTKPRTKDIGVDCPKCGSKVVLKYGKNKSVFYSCEKYPTCDFSSWDMPVNEKCPDCGEILFRKKGKPILVCHNEKCGFTKQAQDLPAEE
ncbi:MAG: type I DNA topoisomerase [Ruminococcaceae bacterium]|nr:type I DNA topoisomerase [Oscillospiraceae bacterium]